nr:MAG TPA: hypothetical protein [Caudoviricetes sp.]
MRYSNNISPYALYMRIYTNIPRVFTRPIRKPDVLTRLDTSPKNNSSYYD